MKTHSLKNYLNLIQKLLDCSQGDEWNILRQSEELIDPALIQTIEQVVARLEAENDRDSAQFLRSWEAKLARLLQPTTTVSPPETNGKFRAYLDLIQALLHCPKGLETDILDVNKDLIDFGLLQMLKQMATQTAEQGDRETASVLNNLATKIEQSWLQALTFNFNLNNYDKQLLELTGAPSKQSDESLAISLIENKNIASSQLTNLASENYLEQHLAAIAASLARLEAILSDRL
ncbi:MAG: hypothetical protein ACRC2R_19590 [Xenococcaceae cyanobacterium]